MKFKNKMNLMQRYQRNQSIINQSKNEDSSQSQIRKLYLSSVHKPMLDPLDQPAPPPNQCSNYNSKPNTVLRTNSNFSQPIKLDNQKSLSNQCIISQSKYAQKEKDIPKKNDITDTGQNKNIQKIPICDYEKNKTGIYSKYSNDTFSEKRPNIELPQIERLPSIFKKNYLATEEDEMKFKKILKAKFDLINTKLDFTNLEMDRPAKQVRLSTINEICQTFMGKNSTFNKEKDEEQLSPNRNYEIYKMIFDFLSDIIFRPTSEPFAKFMFSDDMITITNMELGQTSLCYNALNFSLKDPRLSAHSKCQLFDRKFIQKLFHKFFVPDSGERSLLAQFILDILNFSPEDHSLLVLSSCYNEILMYLQGFYRLPYVLMPSLSVLFNIYNGNVQTKTINNSIDISYFYNDYFQFILPVLGSLHFTSCSQQMVQIIELFVSNGNDDTVFKTVKALLKYFPLTKSSKTLIFISLLSTSLPKLNSFHMRKVTRRLISIVTFCSTSPHFIVSQTCSLLFSVQCIENLIVENSKLVLPLAFTQLNEAMNDAWSEEARGTIKDILERLQKADTQLYNELCSCQKVELKEKYRSLSIRTSQKNLETWKLIAREASQKDRGINLNDALKNIENSFMVDPSLSKYEESVRTTFMLPAVYDSNSQKVTKSFGGGKGPNAGESKNKFSFFFGWIKKRSKEKKK